jgi:hypothetical protein
METLYRMKPIFMAIAIIIMASPMLAIDHSPFTRALNAHVKNGFVDYAGLKKNADFIAYVNTLKTTNPNDFQGNEKLSFWINVYNAFTLRIACDNHPLTSFKDLGAGLVIGTITGTTIWDKKLVTVGGKTYTLNDVENKIIRKMNEPRIHFAIVCAAKSCPPLRSEAYEASKLDAQLTEQAQIFLANTAANRYDIAKKKIYVSKIFDWFDDDFGDNDEEIVKFIAKYAPASVKDSLLQMADDISIKYNDYDWSLNGK